MARTLPAIEAAENATPRGVGRGGARRVEDQRLVAVAIRAAWTSGPGDPGWSAGGSAKLRVEDEDVRPGREALECAAGLTLVRGIGQDQRRLAVDDERSQLVIGGPRVEGNHHRSARAGDRVVARDERR